jgi:hypothetical protein
VSALDAWAASGAMALTGRRNGPALGPPAPLVERLERLGEDLRQRSAAIGSELALDALALLGERAAIAGLIRAGTTSCGGGTRLLRTGDGWVAVTLARHADIELVPAWLGVEVPPADHWTAMTRAVADRASTELVSRAALLGLPVAALGERSPGARPPVCAAQLGGATPTTALDGLVVVDLSSLWAGPLCASLLAAAGATVLKVESTRRPDGARRGPGAFFRLLNANKHRVQFDLARQSGQAALHRLLSRADVVVESSRPRALRQLGVDAHRQLAESRTRVWVSITGYGRAGAAAHRVAFGDDAAVAGGLVTWEDGEPRFCADAIADPTTGLVAAAGCLAALMAGGSWMLDVAMEAVAAHLAGPTLPVPAQLEAAAPRARRHAG